MPGVVALVAAISDDVIAAFAAASLPPLVDGAILLGRQHVSEQSSAPRIVFIPKSSTFPAKDVSSRSTSSNAAERAVMRDARALRGDWKTFEVHCWGIADPPDPDDNYDATETLYQQVIRSIHLLCPNMYQIESGSWNDETLLVTLGREFVFDVTIRTPVLDVILEQVPPGTVGQIDVSLQPADGSAPEVAVTITT